jgi:hypothetical protein
MDVFESLQLGVKFDHKKFKKDIELFASNANAQQEGEHRAAAFSRCRLHPASSALPHGPSWSAPALKLIPGLRCIPLHTQNRP